VRRLLSDVADMERLVDEFLSFARGDAMEAGAADPGRRWWRGWSKTRSGRGTV
jgi:hypothetical protein